jgi:hypothetical protein
VHWGWVSVGFDLRVLEGLGYAWWCVDTAAGLVASSMRALGLGECALRGVGLHKSLLKPRATPKVPGWGP